MVGIKPLGRTGRMMIMRGMKRRRICRQIQRLTINQLGVHFFRRTAHGDALATLNDIAGKETEVFRENDKDDLDVKEGTVLHVTVKDVEQFAVNGVEIATENNAGFLGTHGNNVGDLEKTFVPYFLGFASQ